MLPAWKPGLAILLSGDLWIDAQLIYNHISYLLKLNRCQMCLRS